jgi:hypothetical protein
MHEAWQQIKKNRGKIPLFLVKIPVGRQYHDGEGKDIPDIIDNGKKENCSTCSSRTIQASSRKPSFSA